MTSRGYDLRLSHDGPAVLGSNSRARGWLAGLETA